MVDYGVPGYRPAWLQGRAAVEAAHGARLAALAGRPLTRAWLAWDLDDGSWFADCPVLLDFAGEQVEINHRKLDDLSVTWNSVSPVGGPDWPGLRLAWRAEPLPGLAALRGQELRAVTLLEWRGGKRDLANGAVALGFTFPRGDLVVHNALDENALAFGPPAPRYRRHPLPRRR
ncbi:hypothetical protein C5N14_16560 [Micromonospora sp. MW-13]|uniref:hypothetical protein n=1 Tax=Micromonospora sp. MW-13 TaxID=2094022 RepID=UPI000E44A51A|nr:hypothetical protein [Micromonospora sp. MW-13]RGC67820.1 hypothetical protein C5N14_16560 [Micromonospora sp. MW-13]